MFQQNYQNLAIACASGSFKGAFEEAKIKADAYAAASSSVLPAAWAAIANIGNLEVSYWCKGLTALFRHGVEKGREFILQNN